MHNRRLPFLCQADRIRLSYRPSGSRSRRTYFLARCVPSSIRVSSFGKPGIILRMTASRRRLKSYEAPEGHS